MAGDGDCIRSRDSTVMDCPPEKKAKTETDPEAKTEASPRRVILEGDRNDPEYRRQRQLFAKQFKVSEGFDVEWDFVNYNFNILNFDWQAQMEDDMSNEELMEQLMQAAIEDHNDNHGTNLKSAKYVKANIGGCKGFMYYITFSAIDVLSSDQEPKLYQAKVCKYCDEITVYMARLRPSQNLS